MAKQDKNTNTPADKTAAPSQEKETPRKPTKKSQLIELLSGGKAICLDKLSSALGWQRHTTSAAMTRLKQEGHNLVSERTDGKARAYRIDADPAAKEDGTSATVKGQTGPSTEAAA